MPDGGKNVSETRVGGRIAGPRTSRASRERGASVIVARSHTTKPPRFHRASTRKAPPLHGDEISQPRLALKATGEHPRLGPTFPLPRSAVVGPNGRRRAAVRRGPGRLALLHEHAVVGAPIFEISTGLDKTVFLRG